MTDLREQQTTSLTGSDVRVRRLQVGTGAYFLSFGNGFPTSGRNLEDELERLPAAVDLVVNLDGLRIEDARAVAAALRKSDRLQETDGRTIVVSEHQAIRRALENSGLDRRVLIEHSLDDALRYVVGHELLEELAAGSHPKRLPTPSRARGTAISPLSPLRLFNLVFRVLMETGIVAALGYWGVQTGTSTGTKIALGLSAPILGFGFWGAVDFHRAGRLAEQLRLLQELAISGLAAVALYTTGQHALGWALALLSLVHHALVYLLGGRVLERRS